ncbi:MAG: fasciclin domain-containing protein [Candidatus Aminicenantes bacterium]|jgi:uncharacterized surface protein with fasciclin (FAS1) repeats
MKQKNIILTSIMVLVFGVSLIFAGGYGEKKNIVETAIDAGSFKTLVTAVKAANLVDTLSGKGPFTVFAPTDDAFAKLPEGTIEALLKDTDKLTSILTYHVVPGKIMAEKVVKLDSAKTVNGKNLSIKVKDGKVMVDNALVTKTDIKCSNGVIHVIDAVVLPK